MCNLRVSESWLHFHHHQPVMQNNNIYVSNCSSKINQLICVSTIQVFSQVMTGYDPLIHVDSTYLIIDMSNICCLPFLAMYSLLPLLLHLTATESFGDHTLLETPASTLFIRFGGTYGRPRMHLTKTQNGPLFLKSWKSVLIPLCELC